MDTDLRRNRRLGMCNLYVSRYYLLHDGQEQKMKFLERSTNRKFIAAVTSTEIMRCLE